MVQELVRSRLKQDGGTFSSTDHVGHIEEPVRSTGQGSKLGLELEHSTQVQVDSTELEQVRSKQI